MAGSPEFYDIRVLRGSRTRIVLDNGKLEEISQAPFQGAAVRALSGGAWGFVTTDSVDNLGPEIDSARIMARKIDRQEDFRLAPAMPGKSHGPAGQKRSQGPLFRGEGSSFAGD